MMDWSDKRPNVGYAPSEDAPSLADTIKANEGYIGLDRHEDSMDAFHRRVREAIAAKEADARKHMEHEREIAARVAQARAHGILGPQVTQTRETPFEHVNAALNHARELAMRLERLADKLVGEEPEVVGRGESPRVENGLFGAVGAMGQDIQAAIYRATVAIERIERALP